jgi:hypothetical protein
VEYSSEVLIFARISLNSFSFFVEYAACFTIPPHFNIS